MRYWSFGTDFINEITLQMSLIGNRKFKKKIELRDVFVVLYTLEYYSTLVIQ